eukprot:840530_1
MPHKRHCAVQTHPRSNVDTTTIATRLESSYALQLLDDELLLKGSTEIVEIFGGIRTITHALIEICNTKQPLLDLKQSFADLRDSHDDTHANDHDHEPLINNDKSTSGFLGCELNLLSTPKPILHRICDFLTNNEVNRFKMVYQTGYRCTAGIVQVTNLCI